mmetsp:Transcript_4367/g.6193  ORF Transcript_4367/g.6193 Transcript_4367/m.6193 type:complete len:313 (-) Transcript_4367:250-1188(-)
MQLIRLSFVLLLSSLTFVVNGLERLVSDRSLAISRGGGEKAKVIDPRGTPLVIKAARPLAALTKRYDAAIESNPKLELYVQLGSTLISYRLSKKYAKSSSGILFARVAFIAFLLLHQIVLSFIQERILIVDDTTPLKIPANPLIAQLAARQGNENDANPTNEAMKGVLSNMMERDTTVRDYDLELVKKGRNSQIGSLLLMAYLHLRRGYLQPLIMQTFLGIFSLLRDPLVQIYIYQRQSDGKLARPFKPPTPAWLKAMEEQTKALDVNSDKDEDSESAIDEEATKSEEDDVLDEEDDDYDEEFDEDDDDLED